MSLGAKIRELRQARGWTQQKLTDKAGVGHAYISRLERDGFKNPSADILLRLARTLKVDINQLYEAAGYIGERSERSEEELNELALRVIPLLPSRNQHAVGALVRELAKIEGIEIPTPEEEMNATP